MKNLTLKEISEENAKVISGIFEGKKNHTAKVMSGIFKGKKSHNAKVIGGIFG